MRYLLVSPDVGHSCRQGAGFVDSASKQGVLSIGVGQQIVVHVGSFTQLEKAGCTDQTLDS